MFYLILETKQKIRQGYLQNLSGIETQVLLVIESFTDLNSKAYPSQETIAKALKVNTRTVSRAIKGLEQKGFIEKQRKNCKSVNNYTVNDVQMDNLDKIESDRKYSTNRDILDQFKKLYQKTYGIPYRSSESSDIAKISKAKMLEYTDEELDAILEITFRDYNRQWANAAYPRPTIGGWSGFISAKALDIYKAEKAKQDKIEQAQNEDLSKYFRQEF